MKRSLTILAGLLLITLPAIYAQNTWLQKASITTPVNQGTTGCTIGNKIYVTVGSTPGSYFETAPKNDFYEYDPATNVWTKKANTPDVVAGYSFYNGAVAIGSKGYFVLTGGAFWEYDPATNTWPRKLTLPPGITYFQITFSIGNKGYFGWSNLGNDLWEFDPIANTWTKKADYPGATSAFFHAGFTIGNLGYVAVTSNIDPVNRNDLWQYNPTTNLWAQKASFGNQINLGSTGFAIGDKGYIATSSQVTPSTNFDQMYFWEYTPFSNTWVEKAKYPGNPKTNALGLGVGNKGYLGFGFSSFRTGIGASIDWYEYTPSGVTPPTVGTGIGLQGIYYNGINLTGTPLLTRIDSTINFDLSYGKTPLVLSPAPGVVPEDKYSVRWRGQVQPQYSETYTFYTTADDGVRLWVNNVLLVDNFVNQGATEKSGTINLSAGQKYDIVIEYFENTGDAVTKLSWSSASTPKSVIPKSQLYPPAAQAANTGTGLLGGYYNDIAFPTGYGTYGGTVLPPSPLLTRVDTTINFEFSYGKQPVVLSPAPGIVPEDHYSAVWVGQVQGRFTETYTFYTQSDDGIRLWINGNLLIDNLATQAVTEKTTTFNMVAGQRYDIRVEYFENTGDAITKLLWSSASTPKAIVPKTQLYPPANTGTGLQGTYYNGIALAGAPLLTRVDSVINFNLSYGNVPLVLSPAPGIVPNDMYSVRWAGQVLAQYSETYTFYTLSDDGVRLWVNGVKLVDNWVNQAATEKSGTITLIAGQKYDIVIEYYENTGDAVTRLSWSSASTPKAVVPKSNLFPPASSSRVANITAAMPVTDDKATISTMVAAALSPNPVSAGQAARVVVNSDNATMAALNITGANGNAISTRLISLTKGINIVSVPTTGFARGLYVVNIAGAGKPLTLKLIVQ